MVLAFQSPEDLKEWQKEYGASHFSAKDLEQWYVPYMDYLYEHGYLSDKETPPKDCEKEFLTYKEAEKIASMISPELAERVGANRKNREKPFPEEMWWLLYDSLLKAADETGQVEQRSI